MRILRAGQDQAGRTAVTIGVYDGVHRGHRWLLRKLRHAGQSAGLQTALVTFDPHPLRVLRPVAAPRMLADLDQRLCLLSGTGCVDVCVVLDFDTDRSEQQAEDFVEDVLVGQVHAAEIVVGAGFRFGHDRAGDIDLLSRLGEKFAFSVTSIPLLPVGPESAARPCSSTLIRSLVSKGDVESAARLLCRPHEVSGTVAGTSWPRPGRGVPNVVVRVEPD
ncbi:MAG: FAD synthetase family protein, partial [Acidimicrobiales bacterium]